MFRLLKEAFCFKKIQIKNMPVARKLEKQRSKYTNVEEYKISLKF